MSETSMPYVLVLDCGATNVRAGAVDDRGRILHITHLPNAAVRERPDRDWLIWDTETIWRNLLACARGTVAAVGAEGCVAIVVTSFSDDGAPLDAEGRLLYPVVSWQCPRTAGMVVGLEEVIALDELYRITGEQLLPQHALFRILWLRKHAPAALDKAARYVMFPHILNFRLTGRMVNDPTTADSMLLLNMAQRSYSRDLLERFRIDARLLPELLEPGQVIGPLLRPMADSLGLRRSVPVVVGGHDTQFAVLGSGCGVGDVVLSSGTWEIMFTRLTRCFLDEKNRHVGLKHECDAEPGVFNLGFQWMGSGALEWLGELLYSHITDRERRYAAAEAEASRSPSGSHGVRVVADLVPGTIGSGGPQTNGGSISGCTVTTTRGDVYRAMIESLCEKMKIGLRLLEETTRTRFTRLIVVGGGARNSLWNQVRADTLGIPIQLTKQVENTMIGAMMVGFVGGGAYSRVMDVRERIQFFGESVAPRSP